MVFLLTYLLSKLLSLYLVHYFEYNMDTNIMNSWLLNYIISFDLTIKSNDFISNLKPNHVFASLKRAQLKCVTESTDSVKLMTNSNFNYSVKIGSKQVGRVAGLPLIRKYGVRNQCVCNLIGFFCESILSKFINENRSRKWTKQD